MGLSIPSYVTWSNVRRFGKMLPYYICDGSVVHQDALQRIVRGTKDATGKYVGGAGYKNFGSSLRSRFLKQKQLIKVCLQNMAVSGNMQEIHSDNYHMNLAALGQQAKLLLRLQVSQVFGEVLKA